MTVIITGASRGIGKALAYEYAKHGFDLVLTCEKNIDKLDEIKNDIENISLGDARYKDKHSIRVIKGLIDRCDVPSDAYILINNAGKCHYATLQDTSVDEYKELIYSNLDYTFLTTKIVCDTMIKNKQGVIINISSMWGILGSSCESVYAMTKGGINAFTKSLAKEFKESNVDVVAFALGVVDTEMNNHLSDKEKEEFVKTLDGGKMFTAEEVAEKIYNIVANKKYVSGDIIEVNNGL